MVHKREGVKKSPKTVHVVYDCSQMKLDCSFRLSSHLNHFSFRDRSLSQPDVEEATEEAITIQTVKKPKEKSLFGKTCVKHFKLFLNGFIMTFLAEWGDRSQLATIVLASINDIYGIIIGGVLGHSICTGLAVIAGALIAKKISVRAVTFIGAIVFLGLAIASLIWFEPEYQDETINEVLKEASKN